MKTTNTAHLTKYLLLFSIFLFYKHAFGQTIIEQPTSINTDGNDPDTSAILQVQSTTKGVLFPRMTTAERNAIAGPADGLMVYDTDLDGYYFYSNGQWSALNSSGTSFWTANGTDIGNNNAGNVGVNTTSPQTDLEIVQPFGTTSTTSGLQLNAANRRWRMTVGGANAEDGAHFQLLYRNHNAGTYSPYFTTKHTGQVGIGTTNPTERLHVNGNIRVTDDADLFGLDQIVGFNDLRFYGDPNGGPDMAIGANGNIGVNQSYSDVNFNIRGLGTYPIIFRVEDSTGVLGMQMKHNKFLGVGVFNPEQKIHTDGNIRADGGAFQSWGAISIQPDVDNSGDDQIVFNDGTGGEVARIHTNGYFGVGTNNPVAPIHIVGSASLGSLIVAPNENTGGDDAELVLAEDKNAVHNMKFIYDGLLNRLELKGQSAGMNYGPHLIVQRNDGRMGIGTTNLATGYLLSVGGKIACEEVFVELEGSWPDYVFKEDYDLLSLQQVEQHIQEKGHLPGLPSAREVDGKGIEVGEINRLLVEKVEELTLHLIAQQKQLEEQRALIDELIKNANR